jgi:IQ calmodulin-binding motif
MQILIRKQRERVMHKLIMQASNGDEKFLMKDINCEYEYDMLRKMRARAERERVNEAATKIQRWYRSLKSRRLFKLIVGIRTQAAIKVQRLWRQTYPRILFFRKFCGRVNRSAVVIQKYLRGYL